MAVADSLTIGQVLYHKQSDMYVTVEKTHGESVTVDHPFNGLVVVKAEGLEAECAACGQYITLAADGAWEDERGACGCGDGEHYPNA